ncbi:E3 ubiquitin ligase [Entomortierella lignicola]|nr:E3 ubiquitin ligase [Entomortierella lignicola]
MNVIATLCQKSTGQTLELNQDTSLLIGRGTFTGITSIHISRKQVQITSTSNEVKVIRLGTNRSFWNGELLPKDTPVVLNTSGTLTLLEMDFPIEINILPQESEKQIDLDVKMEEKSQIKEQDKDTKETGLSKDKSLRDTTVSKRRSPTPQPPLPSPVKRSPLKQHPIARVTLDSNRKSIDVVEPDSDVEMSENQEHPESSDISVESKSSQFSRNPQKRAKQRALLEGSSQDLTSTSPVVEVSSSPTLTPIRDIHTKVGESSTSSQQPRSDSTISNSISSLTTNSISMDDMALELLVAKEAQSEVEMLRSQVAKLKKEIEFKDAIIAKLQAESTTEKPTATDIVAQGSSSSLAHHNQHRDVGLQCSICVDYFSSPFTVECGHTFCYTCLHSWLEIHKSCPTCRTKLLRRPTLSFNIQEQVQAFISHLPESERDIAMKKLREEENSLKRIQSTGDIWKGLFKPLGLEGFRNTILDDDDGVRRCASCGWEVMGGVCTNCNTLFSDAEVSDDSQDHSDAASEPDQYDSHDSFINDDHIEYEDWSDNHTSGDDDDFNMRPRRPQRTRNAAGRRANALQARRRQQPVVNISDDSDSDNEPDHEYGNDSEVDHDSDGDEEAGINLQFNSDIQESDDPDEIEEVLQRNRHKGRIQSRRAVLISDDDGDDSVEDNTINSTRSSGGNTSSSIDNSNNDNNNNNSNNTNNKGKGKQVASSLTSSNIRGTKRASTVSVNVNERGSVDSSESDSDDDFVVTVGHRNKKQRGGNLESLFE